MQNNFIQFRQQAIDWLNGNRDFDAGIRMLEQSGFKPGVVAKLKRHGVNGPEAPNRLKFLMRELIQAWAMPSEQIQDNTDPSTGLDISQSVEGHDENHSLKLVDAANLLKSGEKTYPENITAIISEYADAYKHRDVLHKQMTTMSEDNDEATMAVRAGLSDQIAELSDRMERLYPLYAKYQTDGQDPTDEDMRNLEQKDKEKQSKGNSETAPDYSSLSKDELQKLRKSVSTKIGRARNMLDFQQESKADTPNPMPGSPKKVKYETKIANLTAELKKIEYAIAALG